MPIWKITALVAVSLLLEGCVPFSTLDKSTLPLIFSLAAAIGAGYGALRDHCEDRCARKAENLERQVKTHVAMYHPE